MTRFQRILCPIDFSSCSRHAFERAVAIAQADGAAVTALHVVPLHTAATVLPYVGPDSLAPIPQPEVNLAQAKADLTSFLALDVTMPVNVTCEVTQAPDVRREVLTQAERLRADLIVMGTHGRSGFNRLVLGSLAEKVLRTANVAVLTVPPARRDVAPFGHEPFQRVLCAVDFSECSLAGLKAAMSIAHQHAARLAVVHVIEPPPPIYDPLVGLPADLSSYHASAELVRRERLRNAVSSAPSGIIQLDQLVSRGQPYREIVRLATDWCSDLIVLGIHGRNAVDRALFGSTVEPVVRHAPCPVLTVRMDAHAASTAA